MSSIRLLAATGLCCCIAGAVAADTHLSIWSTQQTSQGTESETQSVMITTGKVRMEQGESEDTVLLYHRSSNTFFAIQASEQSYMEIDPVKAGEMMDQASQMQQQMIAQLQERMKDMPEEQRQQMMEMMQRSGQTLPGMPEDPVRYVHKGTDTVGGFACRWVEAHQGDRKVRELCLAEPSSMGMPSEDRDTMTAMQSSMVALAKRLGNAGMFQDDMPDGFPVHVRHYGAMGEVTSEQRVQGVSHDRLDASLFEVPPGYEKRELPTLPQQ